MAISEKQRERARQARAALKITCEAATDATASQTVTLYPVLRGSGLLIKAGTRINWEGELKRAAVDLWDRPESWPDAAPTLWEDVAYREGVRIIPEVITAGLAFSQGELGYWPEDGKIYRSKMNSNVWTPKAYATAWDVVST